MNKVMMEKKNFYMHTQRTQIEVNKKILEVLNALVEFAPRAKQNGSLIIVYRLQDILGLVEDFTKTGESAVAINIGDAFFTLIFLKNDSAAAHDFMKNFQHYWLQDISSVYHFDDLPESKHHLYNFINSFLFEINEKRYYIKK